ncbi:FAS1 domain [Penicillium roqueforti FM164]|uniref:FAS1 domain n=1 Tax=Penicillium roqueforti (strain FM164) TaxID=1365484 RepID=W6Q9D9_PENRF|nr:FAS1 domain [Penicillium roqueforti FM164]
MAPTRSMKSNRLTSILFTFLLATSASALWGLSSPFPSRQQPLALEHQEHRSIMDKILPGVVQPQKTVPNEDLTSKDSASPVISDVLPKTKGINIFARLTRDFDPIASRLNDASKNITVLAPRNSAIQALPRKPWENPEDYKKFGEVNAYEGQDGQDRAKRNLQRFVEAHLIPASPWRVGEEVESLAGEKLKWTKEGDKIFIQPGNIEVDSIAEKVNNGEVWILNDVINYHQE